jgi:Holliday junction resolvase RusA-like endonuclease
MKFPVVVDANPKAKDWKRAVTGEAAKAMAGKPLLTGAVALQLVIYRPRPKGHFGTGRNAGRLKDSAPPYPDTKPDLTKLLRGTEDALRGIVWRDDAQVCRQQNGKLFGEPARAEVCVGEMEEHLALEGVS